MDEKTIETYNKGAEYYSKKFKGIGSRKQDVERGISYTDKQNPLIIELGCGDGRDAEEIIKFTDNYIGIDASSEMINIARSRLPGVDFKVEDILSFKCPKEVDVIFAFASLLHLSKKEFSEVLNRYHDKLSERGVFYISLKEGDYDRKVSRDDVGERIFYFYNEEDIKEIVGKDYKIEYSESKIIKEVKWLTVVLRKN